jgi:hypothetical protein
LSTKEWITSNLLIISWSQLSCHRFKIQFIIIALKSVYGIEELVNGLSYASDVLGILLNVNRWVKTNEILRYEVKPEEFEDMFLSFPHL